MSVQEIKESVNIRRELAQSSARIRKMTLERKRMDRDLEYKLFQATMEGDAKMFKLELDIMVKESEFQGNYWDVMEDLDRKIKEKEEELRSQYQDAVKRITG